MGALHAYFFSFLYPVPCVSFMYIVCAFIFVKCGCDVPLLVHAYLISPAVLAYRTHQVSLREEMEISSHHSTNNIQLYPWTFDIILYSF